MTAPSASQKGGMAMDRILTHPILGDTPEGRLVNFTYDGQTLQGIGRADCGGAQSGGCHDTQIYQEET